MKKLFSWITVLLFFLPSIVAQAQEKIGIIIGSFGDIDDPETELKPYIQNTLKDPDILPLPIWLRRTIADLGFYIDRKKLLSQYAAIGGKTGMRDLSLAQAQGIASILSEKGYNAKGYVGFTMTTPFVASALEKAQNDGINKIFLLHQGAQYSKDTAQILFREARRYLSSHPQWDVEVVGIRSYSDDPRFIELIKNKIEEKIKIELGNFEESDICIFLMIHGNVVKKSEGQDPYLAQVMRNIESIRKFFPVSNVSYGFHNHDEIPVLEWTKPSQEQAIKAISRKSCKAVVLNGQISFTTDNLETLYHQMIEVPDVLRNSDEFRRQPKKVALNETFNRDRSFLELMADLVIEAQQNLGDIEKIQ